MKNSVVIIKIDQNFNLKSYKKKCKNNERIILSFQLKISKQTNFSVLLVYEVFEEYPEVLYR